MEWMNAIQSAIKFMEQHITEDISAEDVLLGQSFLVTGRCRKRCKKCMMPQANTQRER